VEGRQVYIEDAASADGNEASTNDNENDGDDDEDDNNDNNDNNNNKWQQQFKLGWSNVGGNGNNDTNITYVAGEVERFQRQGDNKGNIKCRQQHY
jgi:hypothetical protein